MYTAFTGIVKKPLTWIVILVLLVILGMVASSAISNIGTFLGLETKENVQIKLKETENELEKALRVLEENKKEEQVKKELEVITTESNIKLMDEINKLRGQEEFLLEELDRIREQVKEEENKIEIETTINTKPPVTVNTTTVVYKDKLSEFQKQGLQAIMKRNSEFKGAVK